MEIININPKELKMAEYNPRKMTDKEANDLTESIKSFGFVDPLIVNNHEGRENVVIGGHQRLQIALQEAFESVPVVYVSLDEKRERELNLRLNKNLGQWDWDMLANFAEEELTDVGFDSEELDKIFIGELKEDDFDARKEYEQIEEPKSKLGEIYELGKHRLMCGDSTKREDVEKLMNGEKADMVFTDPPYNVGYDYWGFRGTRKHGFTSKRIFNDKKKPEEYQKFIQDSFQNIYDFSKDCASFYCWHGTKTEREVRNGLELSGWHISQTILWLKNSITLSIGQDYYRIYEPCYFGWKNGEKHLINKKTGNKWSEVIILDKEDFENYFDVLFEQREKIVNYQHATQKPVRLAERALKRHSERGLIILDLFSGSGSTLIACEQMDRRCFMMELDPKYVDVIRNRYETFNRNAGI